MYQRFILILFSFFIIVYYTYGTTNNDVHNIHPFIKSQKSCNSCHKLKNFKIKINNPANACATQCLKCHKDMTNHHTIKVRIDEKLPHQLNLTQKKRLTCRTCHNINSKRYDNKSWKAESMFESVFKGKDKYKTYFLIKNNRDGQLCKTCH